jgi:hypothetical protein
MEDDPRRRAVRPIPRDQGPEVEGEARTPSGRDVDCQADPWLALVERADRHGDVWATDGERRSRAETWRVAVVWWVSPAGRQPVLLARRIRLD